MSTPSEDRIYLLKRIAKLDQQLEMVRELLADFQRRRDARRIAVAERLIELLEIDRELIEDTMQRAGL